MADIYGTNKGKLWSDYKAPSNEQTTDQAAMMQQSAMMQTGMQVQPLVIVPFATPLQPLYPTDDDFGFDEGAEIQAEDVPVSAGRRLNVGALLCFVFGLLAVVVAVLRHFVAIEFLDVTEGKSAIDVILAFINKEEGASMLLAIGLAVAVVFSLLTALVGLFTLKKRFPIVGKIFGVLALVGGAVAIVAGFIGEEPIALGIGAYAIAALAVLTAISALIARRKA